ncbi:hypothetical protein D9M68_706200 [compost metagenome]
MKKLILMVLMATAISTFNPLHAQVNIQVNIGAQPQWGPTGYSYVEYYYLPDIETYYHVPSHRFIYLNHDKWIFSRTLPVKYRYYNLHQGYKVVVNKERPYLHFNRDRVSYAKFKNHYGKQQTLRVYTGKKNNSHRPAQRGKNHSPHKNYKH